jgi:hypothetical protein
VTVIVTEQGVPSVVVTTMSVGPRGSTVLTGVKRKATVSTVASPERFTGGSSTTLVPEHVVPERAPV